MKLQHYVLYMAGTYGSKIYRMKGGVVAGNIARAEAIISKAEALDKADNLNNAVEGIYRPWQVMERYTRKELAASLARSTR